MSASRRSSTGPPMMVEIGGGTLLMGSNDFYPEERPVRSVPVETFWIDPVPVTNESFGRFVAETGYVTVAERPPSVEQYPDADPDLLVPGSSVFCPPPGPVDLRDLRNWWAYVAGANWRRPEGPGSDLRERSSHPVVHVAYEDATAYAVWAGKDLPTETEWELAARGGLVGAAYAWGEELSPGGQRLANIWEGQFPWQRVNTDYERTSPVGTFPANGFGLFDMIGNVWEWTAQTAGPSNEEPEGWCCSGRDCQAGPVTQTARVVKGGSFLCSANYCRRYRPAARQLQPIDSSTSHIGFRCVRH